MAGFCEHLLGVIPLYRIYVILGIDTYRLLNYMFLDFYLNFNGLTTTYNFKCIIYLNHVGSHIVRTLYVPNLCYTSA